MREWERVILTGANVFLFMPQDVIACTLSPSKRWFEHSRTIVENVWTGKMLIQHKHKALQMGESYKRCDNVSSVHKYVSDNRNR